MLSRNCLSVLFLVFFLTACGKDGAPGPQGPQGPQGAAGTSGAAGLSVVSNQRISTYLTDMCTQYTGEFCIFSGGQLVKYSDGSVLILGGFNFNYVNGTDTDTDQTSVSLFVPPSVSAGSQTLLSTYVARGSGYRALYLLYTRENDVLALVYDTNNDGTVNAGDEIVTTLSLLSW